MAVEENVGKNAKKINEDDRKNALKLFWDLSEYRLKWQCLFNWTSYTNKTEFTKNSDCESLSDSDFEIESESEISETESNSAVGKEEPNEFSYKLPKIDYAINNNMVSVCRKMFVDTLGISIKFVKTAWKKRMNPMEQE